MSGPPGHPATTARDRPGRGVGPMAPVPPADGAAALVRPVDRIGFGLGPANPDAFLAALGRRDDWEDLILGGALCLNFYDVFTKPGVSYRCGFFGPAEG